MILTMLVVVAAYDHGHGFPKAVSVTLFAIVSVIYWYFHSYVLYGNLPENRNACTLPA